MNCLIVAGFLAIAASAPLAQSGAATAPATSPQGDSAYVASMTFDVASVRENKNIDPNSGFSVSGGFVPLSTTFRATNWDLENLITLAYGLDRYQLEGVPKWPWPTMFMIEARGDSGADAKFARLTSEQQVAEQQHMLQVLLEDRFNLKTHWETKEGDTYNLVVARGGPKLSPVGSMPPSAEELKRFGGKSTPILYQRDDGQGYDFVAHGCSIHQLVDMLSGQFGRPVMDKTQLTGTYDFVLKYKGRWDRDRAADDMDPTLPMDQALQKELGLKLEPAKGAVKILVIDHIEKPSEN